MGDGCVGHFPHKTIIKTETTYMMVTHLETKYGKGKYYFLSTGLQQIYKVSDNRLTGITIIAEEQIRNQRVCSKGYKILDSTIMLHEYGSASIYIKCNFVEQERALFYQGGQTSDIEVNLPSDGSSSKKAL